MTLKAEQTAGQAKSILKTQSNRDFIKEISHTSRRNTFIFGCFVHVFKREGI